MLRCFFLITFISLAFCSLAQTPKTDKELLDSLIQNDPLMRELDSLYKPSSYGVLAVTVGNKIFSLRNNRLNTLQNDGKFVVSPSAGYYHKSGLGISVVANMLTDSGKFSFYQTSITPSFDVSSNKNFATGISYTRYFVRDKYSRATSPVQNDFYAYFLYKKKWINPSISFGYANGTLNDIYIIDTTIGPRTIRIIDTVKTSLNTFSLTAGIEHSFRRNDLLQDNDALLIRPQILLNFGSNKYVAAHSSSFPGNIRDPRPSRITRYFQQTSATGFEIQSLAFALSTDYSFGSIFIKPNIYLDYYLPETTDKRFTAIVSLNVGYIF